MAPHQPLLTATDEEFRYAAECRRLARLARAPQRRVSRRIDIAGYLRALDSLDHVWRPLAVQFARTVRR